MKKFLFVVFVSLLFTSAYAQQDSVVVSRLVKEEIARAKQKEQEPLKSTNNAGFSEEATAQKPPIPQSVFYTLFVGSQILLAVGFGVYRIKRRTEESKQPKPHKRTDNSFALKTNRYSESRRVRSMVGCQLQLLRTREELTSQARKLNVGAGELELAWKLQEMSSKS